MQRSILLLLVMGMFVLAHAQQTAVNNNLNSPYVKLKNVNLQDCHWTGGFWGERSKLIREVTIPHIWNIFSDPEVGYAYHNFQVAAGLAEGTFQGSWWHDGDFYKWLEAACYLYAQQPSDSLLRAMDDIIAIISKAQEKDGYISSPITITGKPRFEALQHHELYNMGHLFTTACIHQRVTGKKNLLIVAEKAANYLNGVFNPLNKELAHYAMNPSQIMGLVELYRTTGNKTYLELARIFTEQKGHNDQGTDINQSRTPLLSETEAKGHAVMAMYLYSGAADVFAENGDTTYIRVLKKLWEDIVLRKMYVHGGIGSHHQCITEAGDHAWEAFGKPYELPLEQGYNETCANISNAMFNWRMMTLLGASFYADIIELELYNAALAGISIDGKHFSYTNPVLRTKDYKLQTNDLYERQMYFESYCCPPNLTRTIAKSSNWAYTLGQDEVYVVLYGSNEIDSKLLSGEPFQIKQTSNYPWDGNITLDTHLPGKKKLTLNLRIPLWAESAKIKINGEPLISIIEPGSFASITRVWKPGDKVEMHLPMPVTLLEADPRVEASANKLAVRRGPMVYCLESKDLPENVSISDVGISAKSGLYPVFKEDLLGGLTILEGEGFHIQRPPATHWLYQKTNFDLVPIPIRLIPYYAWNNRGRSAMTVWMPRF